MRRVGQGMEGTTILSVRHQGISVMIGDGQVTLGHVIIKGSAKKVRRLYHNTVLAGFAGSTSDALTLFERFESKLEKYSGDMVRAAVELTKDWRLDKVLRRLEAMLLVADSERQFLLSGSGDVLQPDEPVMAIGSGGDIAQAAAMALIRHSSLSAEKIAGEAMKIASEAMKIASERCIYTNSNFTLETIPSPLPTP